LAVADKIDLQKSEIIDGEGPLTQPSSGWHGKKQTDSSEHDDNAFNNGYDLYHSFHQRCPPLYVLSELLNFELQFGITIHGVQIPQNRYPEFYKL